MRPTKKTLKNGVRLITVPMKDNPALTVMVLAGSGSNNETKDQRGLAHFLEHMVMKGGEKYSSPYAVSATLDSLGAESNAMTGHEFTGYYAKGHPKHFAKMLEVVADVYLRARLDAEELERERGVIIEEINLYDDLPMRRAASLFYETAYGDQPAGWHTLGTKQHIHSFRREDFVQFKDQHYVAENTVVIVAGDLPKQGLTKAVEEKLADIPAGRVAKRKKPTRLQGSPRVRLERRQTDQLHFHLGAYAYPAGDRRVPALKVLNAVLGGGMSSRLFQKLREEMGVCYYVRSSTDLHDNHGHLVVSAGVDTKRTVETIQEVVSEFRRLREEPVAARELKKAQDYLIGSTYLELETSEGVSDFFLEQEVLTGELQTPQQFAKEIKAVTAQDVRKVARDILRTDRLNLAAVGKIPSEAAVKKALKI